MRKLVTIRTIDEIKPIVDADAIELAIIDGWQCVIKKGEFQVNDKVMYFEIDSWVSHEIAPFLSKGSYPRTYMEIEGNRVRTIILRGQISQGLALPLLDKFKDKELGYDLSDELGVVKYEAPIVAYLAGIPKGVKPDFIPKTDQERIQNIYKKIDFNKSWEVTEKMEGAFMSIFYKDGEVGVTSTNTNLKEDINNTYWKVAIEQNLIDKINNIKQDLGFNVVLQGELVGEGIQGNIHNIKGHKFFLFDIFNIDTFTYLLPEERRKVAKDYDIDHVAVIDTNFSQQLPLDELLTMADGKCYHSKHNREGIVFKSNTDNTSFKVISNQYLIKEK